MDIQALRLLIEVARRGSFAGVARDHGADPSSVSRIVAGLEAELGVRLLQRTTRTMRLTDAGARYVERVGPLIDGLEHAREELTAARTDPSGLLRVTASVSFGQAVLAPLLPAFRAAFPRLDLELVLSDSQLDLVTERLDLAFRLGPSVRADVVGTKLFDTHYRVVASPEYLAREGAPSEPAALAERSCVLFALPGFRTQWQFRSGGAIRAVPVRGGVIGNNAGTLRIAALLGLGPALLPDWLIGGDLSEGRLSDLFPEHEVTATTFETAAWLLYPSGEQLARRVRMAIAFFRERLYDGVPPGLRNGAVFV